MNLAGLVLAVLITAAVPPCCSVFDVDVERRVVLIDDQSELFEMDAPARELPKIKVGSVLFLGASLRAGQSIAIPVGEGKVEGVLRRARVPDDACCRIRATAPGSAIVVLTDPASGTMFQASNRSRAGWSIPLGSPVAIDAGRRTAIAAAVAADGTEHAVPLRLLPRVIPAASAGGRSFEILETVNAKTQFDRERWRKRDHDDEGARLVAAGALGARAPEGTDAVLVDGCAENVAYESRRGEVFTINCSGRAIRWK
jgi:hypothetical protein